MRPFRVVSVRPLVLLPVALVCLLGLLVFTVIRGNFSRKESYRRLFNRDAGQEVCLQRSAKRGEPLHRALELAPCRRNVGTSDDDQSFHLSAEGLLRAVDGLCVDSGLRLVPCHGQQHAWAFTQGSGLVHVESGRCLTRGAGPEVALLVCDDRPHQYWWLQRDRHDLAA
ncbi:uncharacterized protein LOC119099143 [Pollicipes pollicipes]|uniref:uncharacterized protein LOC119099143 n=1 Tax=Pollicipes pollicipes TaxID=41117 RepID=UPI001884F908|nr:uncharacterized protein LOC119099143 [Pollicipes pollicipes]XP_037078140.1 uncharacterized protein LOC119099143 [Pollicipes pollicipes]XP_037078141.1 uncharacterized protein LOC119099143 [Pollicipes pollicipes]